MGGAGMVGGSVSWTARAWASVSFLAVRVCAWKRKRKTMESRRKKRKALITSRPSNVYVWRHGSFLAVRSTIPSEKKLPSHATRRDARGIGVAHSRPPTPTLLPVNHARRIRVPDDETTTTAAATRPSRHPNGNRFSPRIPAACTAPRADDSNRAGRLNVPSSNPGEPAATSAHRPWFGSSAFAGGAQRGEGARSLRQNPWMRQRRRRRRRRRETGRGAYWPRAEAERHLFPPPPPPPPVRVVVFPSGGVAWRPALRSLPQYCSCSVTGSGLRRQAALACEDPVDETRPAAGGIQCESASAFVLSEGFHLAVCT
uniref:Uncharacterized protein n=1 Tax=Oryza meridionalis TaxID=40149 RepID=A0A0E0D0V6_9ORYZ